MTVETTVTRALSEGQGTEPVATPSLRQLQARLWLAITARNALPEGLQDLGLQPDYVSGFVQGDDRLDAVGRVDIYNGMYFLRILDCVREDFPATIALLGNDNDYDLFADYVQALPPDHPSVRDASTRLPGFLADWAGSHAQPTWLADLAALEWALIDIFDEADTTSLTLASLQTTPPERLPDLPLRPIAAHRILDLDHDISPTWRALVKEGTAPLEVKAPTQKQTRILAWRDDLTITHRIVDPEESPLVDLLVRGTTFGLLCEHLGQTHDEATAAQKAVATLVRWAQEGLLATPSVDP